ncbi:hypothetical protein C4579_02160 [Candidatus Microgenomates bacterium]|nr:MAG: hypothetical protein C4579_02160 [Candidatus Microgenomates bacterium]
MVGFFSFIKLTGSPDRQALIGLITALAYVGWGVFHHMHEGDLHWKIVIEYGSLAVFGFATLYALLMFAS